MCTCMCMNVAEHFDPATLQICWMIIREFIQYCIIQWLVLYESTSILSQMPYSDWLLYFVIDTM